MESDPLFSRTVEMKEGNSGTSTAAEIDGTRTTTATTATTTKTTTMNMPSWSQAEVDSSLSAQRPIPPNEETEVFSWADVTNIVGMSPHPYLIPECP